jgi:hypothetical protein
MASRKRKTTRGKGGARRALCVGINDYPGTGSDLSGCVNDANDWAAALRGRGYQVTTLLDSQARYAPMVRALNTLVSAGRRGDSLVFTFSGHGSWLPDNDGDEVDGRDEMLCPHDISTGGRLMDDELAVIFGRKADGVRLFFISDSCHSGTVAKFMAPMPRGLSADVPRPRYLPPSVFVRGRSELARIRQASRVGTVTRQKYPALLASGCRDTEYSYDASFGGRPNGAFTYWALQSLRKNPRTPLKWMAEVRRKLPSTQHPQTPGLYGSVISKLGGMF